MELPSHTSKRDSSSAKSRSTPMSDTTPDSSFKEKKILPGRRQQRHSTEIGSEYHRWWVVRNALGFETNEHIAGLLLDGFHALLQQVVLMCGGDSYNSVGHGSVRDASCQFGEEDLEMMAAQSSLSGQPSFMTMPASVKEEGDEAWWEYKNAITFYTDHLWRMCSQPNSGLQELDKASQPLQDFIMRLIGYLRGARGKGITLNYRKKRPKTSGSSCTSSTCAADATSDIPKAVGKGTNHGSILQPGVPEALPQLSSRPKDLRGPFSTSRDFIRPSTNECTATQTHVTYPVSEAGTSPPVSYQLRKRPDNSRAGKMLSANKAGRGQQRGEEAQNKATLPDSSSDQYRRVSPMPLFGGDAMRCGPGFVGPPVTSACTSTGGHHVPADGALVALLKRPCNIAPAVKYDNTAREDLSLDPETVPSGDASVSNAVGHWIPLKRDSSSINAAPRVSAALSSELWSPAYSSENLSHRQAMESTKQDGEIPSKANATCEISNKGRHLIAPGEPRYIAAPGQTRHGSGQSRFKASEATAIPIQPPHVYPAPVGTAYSAPLIFYPTQSITSHDGSLASLSSLVQNIVYDSHGTILRPLTLGASGVNVPNSFSPLPNYGATHILSPTALHQLQAGNPPRKLVTTGPVNLSASAPALGAQKPALGPFYISSSGIGALGFQKSQVPNPAFQAAHPGNPGKMLPQLDRNKLVPTSQTEDRGQHIIPPCQQDCQLKITDVRSIPKDFPNDFETYIKNQIDSNADIQGRDVSQRDYNPRGQHIEREQIMNESSHSRNTNELQTNDGKNTRNSVSRNADNISPQSPASPKVHLQNTHSTQLFSLLENNVETTVQSAKDAEGWHRRENEDVISSDAKQNGGNVRVVNGDSTSSSQTRASPNNSSTASDCSATTNAALSASRHNPGSHKLARTRPLVCGGCQLVFDSGTDLLVHRYEQHSYVCGECDGRFLSASGLHQHKASDHPDIQLCTKCRFHTFCRKTLVEHTWNEHQIKLPGDDGDKVEETKEMHGKDLMSPVVALPETAGTQVTEEKPALKAACLRPRNNENVMQDECVGVCLSENKADNSIGVIQVQKETVSAAECESNGSKRAYTQGALRPNAMPTGESTSTGDGEKDLKSKEACGQGREDTRCKPSEPLDVDSSNKEREGNGMRKRKRNGKSEQSKERQPTQFRAEEHGSTAQGFYGGIPGPCSGAVFPTFSRQTVENPCSDRAAVSQMYSQVNQHFRLDSTDFLHSPEAATSETDEPRLVIDTEVCSNRDEAEEKEEKCQAKEEEKSEEKPLCLVVHSRASLRPGVEGRKGKSCSKSKKESPDEMKSSCSSQAEVCKTSQIEKRVGPRYNSERVDQASDSCAKRNASKKAARPRKSERAEGTEADSAKACPVEDETREKLVMKISLKHSESSTSAEKRIRKRKHCQRASSVAPLYKLRRNHWTESQNVKV